MRSDVHTLFDGGYLTVTPDLTYQAVLAPTMARRGFRVERQKAIRFEYDGMAFEEGQPSASSRLRVNQRRCGGAEGRRLRPIFLRLRSLSL